MSVRPKRGIVSRGKIETSARRRKDGGATIRVRVRSDDDTQRVHLSVQDAYDLRDALTQQLRRHEAIQWRVRRREAQAAQLHAV